MKKLLTCFFAITMFAPSVYAADGAVSRVIPTGDMTKTTASRAQNDDTNESVKSSSRTAVSRVANRDIATPQTSTENTIRSTVSRVFSGAPAKEAAVEKKTISRGGVVSRTSAPAAQKNTRGGLDAAVNTVGRNDRVSSASINSDPSVRRAGLVLRPSTAEVGGRATIGDTGIQTGSNIDEQLRSVKSRASNVVATAESIQNAKEILENTADLNKSCQEQYNECMDQFCAVVDANQKRCSCSANVSKYAKVEQAVKDANVQLNDVAQRIRYVGLSADEIRAIMTETEAEEALSGTRDTSETRDMLTEIEKLIRDPKSSTSSYSSGDTGFGLDIDLDFSSDSADMFSLDFLNTDSGSNLSSLRGAELYNAAKKRCNTVLNQCKQAGATSNQITGNYDLAIDKDCIAYEQGLTKMNETLVGNVRSANLMLQKARLAVLQNKNQYDAKGCIGALEACMTDDMVCGEDYYKCVDPTKKYIDENGKVVLGQKISNITAFMEKYNNASINQTFLSDAYGTTISEDNCNSKKDGSCVVKYLLTKIGTKQKVTDEGLCRAVLDKCQNYTYESDGNYKPYNDVVTNYVQRALVNIRAAQYKIISEYAESCMLDIANCYNQQVTQINSWSSSASLSSIHNVMRGACRNVALTCAYAVFDNAEDKNLCNTDENCINSVSEMFYNSLLCDDGYKYVNGRCVSEKNRVIWNFNNMASGFDNTAGTISDYLEKDTDFYLPLLSSLQDVTMLGYNDICFSYHQAWCYRIDANKLYCTTFGSYQNVEQNGNGNCNSGKYQGEYRTVMKIPAAHVNKMIERGDTNIFLSSKREEHICKQYAYTIWDEKGCRCMSGNGSSASCTQPNVTYCPSGYTKNTTSNGYSCSKAEVVSESNYNKL